jgi:hypothetical protein
MGRYGPLMIGSMGMIGAKEVAEPGAQWRPVLRATRHETVERCGRAGFSDFRRKLRQ